MLLMEIMLFWLSHIFKVCYSQLLLTTWKHSILDWTGLIWHALDQLFLWSSGQVATLPLETGHKNYLKQGQTTYFGISWIVALFCKYVFSLFYMQYYNYLHQLKCYWCLKYKYLYSFLNFFIVPWMWWLISSEKPINC